MINNYCLDKKKGGAEARGGERSSGEKVVVRETRSTMEGYNNQWPNGRQIKRNHLGGKFEKEQAATVTNRFSKTGASSMTSKGRGRYNSHLTHINGWFDFGSTLGRAWTGKTLRTLVAAITLVLMVLGAGVAWGQSRIGAQRSWTSNDANTGVPSGTNYTFSNSNCTTGDYYEFRGSGIYSNYDDNKWIYFTAPSGCAIKITLTENNLQGSSNRDRIYYQNGTTNPGTNNSWSNQSGNATYISTGSNTVAIRFQRNSRGNQETQFTIRVECWCKTDGGSINMQNGSTMIDCDHLYYFYDSGGENGNYDNNEDFTYTFTTGYPSTVIHIRFLSYNGENRYDYITINNGGTQLDRVSTMSVPREYVTTAGNDLSIRWQSDNIVNYNGWSAMVWAEGCPTCTEIHPSFSSSTLNCSLGSTCTPPSLTNNPSSGSITYSSSDESVATVGTNGALTLVGGGTTTITATIEANGDYCAATASYTLNVTCVDPQLTLSETSGTMVIGGGTLDVGALASSNSGGTITWTSSDNGVATVSSSGVVTAVGAGTATITGIQVASGSYCGATVSYTVTVQCADVSIVAVNSHSESVSCMDEGDGICYLNVCAPETITLSKTGTMNPSSYTWKWNCYDNTGEHTSNGSTLQLSLTQQRGYDVWMTVSGGGCEVTRQARIRVSGGIVVHAGDLSDIIINDDGAGNPQPICVGTEACITIGSGSGSDVQIDEPSVHVEASLGQGVQTFIPDGPNCTEQCYTSSVTFNDFDADSRVTSVNDIEYIRINMEHSFISDMQIKLICPTDANGVTRSAIILEDQRDAANGGLYNDTYTWPYYKISADYGGYWELYENIGGDGDCVQGNRVDPGYVYRHAVYVVYDGTTYTGTGIGAEATSFDRNITVAEALEHLRGMVNSGITPSDFCDGEYYYKFNRWGSTANQYTNNNYNDRWSTYLGALGFGNPNVEDAYNDGNVCDEDYNDAGTGLDYCWSNNTSTGYVYATGAVYETANHQTGTTTSKIVIPSNLTSEPPSQIYHPHQNFSNLVGCPLNGTWSVQVCDSWEGDNGWIFNWELKLSEDKLPTMWGYDITLDTSMLTCTGTVHTEYNKPNLCVKPQFGDDTSGCKLTFVDNFGCESSIENQILFILDSAWINLKSGNPVQQFCEGSAMASPIVYAYGDIKYCRTEFKEYEYS